MNKTYTTLSLLLACLLIGGVLISTNSTNQVERESKISEVITNENGIQVINIVANSKGYSPNKVTAQAGINTILRMSSENSYGCERSFNIPSMNLTEILPIEGHTDIDLGIPKQGENIFGSCSMGMYTLKILFE